eukprot:TRINITY_DN51061_c0_g1_i1.p1 TRINITY_DN51061_c0_g1~~TRINITY_DN51061_c0_g1_i1.p1  ORF type:complete len:470 (-),score=100.76 TRINITY_DN51061_c0_g1_i1:38-1447(-)
MCIRDRVSTQSTGSSQLVMERARNGLDRYKRGARKRQQFGILTHIMAALAIMLVPLLWRQLVPLLPSWSGSGSLQRRIEQHRAFEEWLTECGGWVDRDAVQVKQYGKAPDDIGLFATRKIQQGSTVARVPYNCMPSWSAATSVLKKNRAGALLLKRMPGFEGELFLLLTRRLPNSRWAGFLQSMPDVRSLAPPPLLPELEAELEGSSYLAQIEAERAQLQEAFGNVSIPIAWPRVTEQEWRWACRMASSRTWQVEFPRHSQMSFFPVGELLLHDQRNNIRVEHRDGQAELVATEDIQKEGGLYDMYGAGASNVKFYLDYGFAHPGVGYDTDEASVVFKFGRDCVLAVPLAFAEVSGGLDWNGRVARTALSLVRASSQGKESCDVQALSTEGRTAAEESAVIELVSKSCQSVLDQFGSTLTEDLQLLASSEGTDKLLDQRQNLVLLRAQEKHVLHQCVNLLDAQDHEDFA